MGRVGTASRGGDVGFAVVAASGRREGRLSVGSGTQHRYRSPMDKALDRISLAFGRRPPTLLSALVGTLWWASFALLMVSPLLGPNGAASEYAASLGLDLERTVDSVVWPTMLGLAVLTLAHMFLSRRRDRLVNNISEKSVSGLNRNPYWAAMAVVIAAGIGMVIYAVVSDVRVSQQCETYAQQHRTLPNEVVDCPFDR